LKPSYLIDGKNSFNPAEKPKTSKTLEVRVPALFPQLTYRLYRLLNSRKFKEKKGKGKEKLSIPTLKYPCMVWGSTRKPTKPRRLVLVTVTHIPENNGFNPVWDTTFKFTVGCPDLSKVFG
jgi:hypothetical protein